MTERRSPRTGAYERARARAVARARDLVDAEEQVEAAAILQRGLRPRYALVLMSLGAGLFVPGLTSPESLVPDAVRWFVALPLFVAGALAMAIPGQALLILTAGTAYVVSRPPLPGLRARLIADCPASVLEVDLERGLVTLAERRLWALAGQASSLRPLAGAVGDPSPAPRRRRWWLIGVAGAAIVAALVADAAIETDAEEIERVIAQYNDDLVRGRGEEACAALTARARAELVEEATARLAQPLEPPTCREGVEAVADRLSDSVRDRQARTPAILDVEVEGDRASAQVGASFAYQRIPLARDTGGWKLATVQAVAVVNDAPADDPPSPADFAARVEAQCKNSVRRFVPAAARLVASPDPTTDRQAAEPVAGLLGELSGADRILADDLSSLTPPADAQDELRRVVEGLRNVARVRDRLAEAITAGGASAVEQAGDSAGNAQRSYRDAAVDANLEIALGDCL